MTALTENQRDARDLHILDLAQAGYPQREIERMTGVSRRVIGRLIRDYEAQQ